MKDSKLWELWYSLFLSIIISIIIIIITIIMGNAGFIPSAVFLSFEAALGTRGRCHGCRQSPDAKENPELHRGDALHGLRFRLGFRV